MSRPPDYRLALNRNVETMLRGNRRLSLRFFIEEYDYEAFLDVEARVCGSARGLATAFACRFLETVSSDYSEALTVALVNFLAECCGRSQLDKSDFEAAKALVELPNLDPRQFGMWLDAYFRDVA